MALRIVASPGHGGLALAMPGLLLAWVLQGGILPALCPSLAGAGASSGWWFCMCVLLQTVDAQAADVPWPLGS